MCSKNALKTKIIYKWNKQYKIPSQILYIINKLIKEVYAIAFKTNQHACMYICIAYFNSNLAHNYQYWKYIIEFITGIKFTTNMFVGT